MLEWVGRQGLLPTESGPRSPLPQYSILFESKLVDRKQGTSHRLPDFGLLRDMGRSLTSLDLVSSSVGYCH